MTRLPIRLRVTIAFAVAVAAVLAALGVFVYLGVGGALLASLDRTLGAQAVEASARTHDERALVDPDVGSATTLAQLLDANGTIERFSRADAARERGGAGLDLSIVSMVAEAHGGVATVANRREGGSDVWLTLPHRARAAAADTAGSLHS